jgi:hypothetical protein
MRLLSLHTTLRRSIFGYSNKQDVVTGRKCSTALVFVLSTQSDRSYSYEHEVAFHKITLWSVAI